MEKHERDFHLQDDADVDPRVLPHVVSKLLASDPIAYVNDIFESLVREQITSFQSIRGNNEMEMEEQFNARSQLYGILRLLR